MGVALNMELNTADDLINLQLPENLASQLGSSSISAGQFFNFLILLSDPSSLPEGSPSIPIPGGTTGLIKQISPDAIQFLIDHDADFLGRASSRRLRRFLG